MKVVKGKYFIRPWLKKWRKIGKKMIPCREWADKFWSFSMHEEDIEDYCSVGRDVPKGHLVVYVGENNKRFVIKVKLLNHPVFKPLLDQARDEYDYTVHSKFFIPCDENHFLSVVRCASSSSQNQTLFKCL